MGATCQTADFPAVAVGGGSRDTNATLPDLVTDNRYAGHIPKHRVRSSVMLFGTALSGRVKGALWHDPTTSAPRIPATAKTAFTPLYKGVGADRFDYLARDRIELGDGGRHLHFS